MERIVTLTMNPSVDVNSSLEHVIADRKLRCHSPRYEPGGGGINVSRAIRRLGGDSFALFPAGGTFGQMLHHLLDQEGVQHYPIPIEESIRENFTILEESSGRQFRFGMPGPMIRETEWKQCIGTLVALDPKPNYVVASGSLPPGGPEDFYSQLAQIAPQFEIKLIVDTSGEPLRLALRAGVYLLKPNMSEMQSLAGREIKDEFALEETAREIIEKEQVEALVISLGAGGALLVSREGCEHVRAPTVPIKSRIGAGDSMVAGMVLSLANGKSLGDAVRFGVAAGASAVMTPGTELCRREDTERLYQQILVKTHEALKGD